MQGAWARGLLAAAAAIACLLGPAPAAITGEGHATALRLAQTEEPQADGTSEDGSAEPSREEPSGDAAGHPPAGDDDSFDGSAEPAGPDLTAEEERELISRGWD